MTATDVTVCGSSAEIDAWDATATRVRTPCGGPHQHMVWRRWGQGSPAALLHGGAGSWRHWVRTIPVLADRFRVLAPDLPGLGESDALPARWSPDASAAVVAAGLWQMLGPDERVDIVGFSAGAMVAGLVAARLGHRCRTLVLVGASGLGTRREPIALEQVREKQGEMRRTAHRANLLRLMIADSDAIDEQALAIQEWNTVHARVNSVGFAETAVLRDALPAVRGQLKAIWGANDAVAGATLAERCAVLRDLRPDVEICIIPSAGHWVAYEAADAFNNTLVAMLGGDTNATGGRAHEP